jgi:hypothetical protein
LSRKSEDAFPQHFVAGNVCSSGMIKRTWGKSVRNVPCPICDGTGLRKKLLILLKWIKFWFDKDGKYITLTGTDGQVRGQSSQFSKFKYEKTPETSVKNEISREELCKLPTGNKSFS